MILLDTATAAAAAGVTPATIRQWVHRGRLHPAGRLGRAHAFDIIDIWRLDNYRE